MTATTTSRALWTAASGFEDPVISADPAGIIDGELQVVLQTKLGDHLLARVPPADDADAAKYEYWDGHGWSNAASAAVPMWPHPHAADNVGAARLIRKRRFGRLQRLLARVRGSGKRRHRQDRACGRRRGSKGRGARRRR